MRLQAAFRGGPLLPVLFQTTTIARALAAVVPPRDRGRARRHSEQEELYLDSLTEEASA